MCEVTPELGICGSFPFLLTNIYTLNLKSPEHSLILSI